MTYLFEARSLTREYGKTIALNNLNLDIPAGSVIGLIGRNGSGKTTLLDHILGLRLPTSGTCHTFGTTTAELGVDELSRIGAVHQENRLLDWMTVKQHLRYVASFHKNWDMDRERQLLDQLDIDESQTVLNMSPGNAQKLAILLAVCGRPDLLILDEPVSAMDPIARERLLTFLLELVREDQTTVVISSHVLRDVERIVNRVLCLEKGRIIANTDLDRLLESYCEWLVTPVNGNLPGPFSEHYVLEQEGNERCRRLVVQNAEADRLAFESRHRVLVERKALNLEGIFPHLVGATSAIR